MVRQRVPQNRPDEYDVKSWIFLPQHGNGSFIINADSLETIWRQWRPLRELMEINIEPCTNLNETVALYRGWKAVHFYYLING